ncbi:nucleotidyltransferase domain-containing protein [Lactobacillus xylocopicola]|uniref:Polymerase nucleotidyl transferase domain-containing protein n=1 Tax=Lactobacillus xylocopicola TaxID=2976676 RepID=A0ABM8BGM5_9LACO|nr:hypothetical protein KIM322_06800 [Lactobacillus xylocopicola]
MLVNDLKTHHLITKLKEQTTAIIKDNLVGLYLHGSLVLGGYNPQVSDIDFIVVINKTRSSTGTGFIPD